MANKVYQHDETAITWLASAGTNVLTLTSLGASAGRQGALYDFGTAARARDYVWRFYCKFATTPVVAERITVYWKTSDGTNPDNDDGTGDAAVSAQDKLRNLRILGHLEVDEASTTPTFVASGYLPAALVSHRYGAPVIWNGTADALSSTAAEHGFQITPVPPEVQ